MADEYRMALLELLRKAGMDGDADFLREGVKVMGQALMELEVSQHIGAERHERTPDRTGQRNGYRDRSWDTYVGQVVRTAKPMRIVCIGIGVHSALRDRLSGLGVPVTVVPQPNAHLDADAHLAVFQQYYPIVLQALQE